MSAANHLPTPERSTPHPQHVGPYRVLGSLGQGTMGAIRLATVGSATTRKLVVLKEIRRDAVPNGQVYKRVLAQAELNSRVTHENVVKTLGLVRSDGEQYLALEFLHGQPFNQIVQTSRLEPKVPLRLRLQVIRDTLAGLHHAHELKDDRGHSLQLVHGDINPANVFVTYDGLVKVVNFGLARAAQLTPKDAGSSSRWRYAPPELLLGEPLDRRADVFCVGIMLWETICLRRFTSSSASDRTTVQRRVSGAEPRIAQVSPQVPPRLAVLCDKALNVRREDRFGTAEEFHAALVEYMEVSGSKLRASAVGGLLSKKFEVERTGVEKRIKRYSEAAEDVRTSVELRRNTFEVDDDEPTTLFTGTVASLPAMRSGPRAAVQRGVTRPLLLLGLGIAVLTLGTALAMRQQKSAPTESEATAGRIPEREPDDEAAHASAADAVGLAALPAEALAPEAQPLAPGASQEVTGLSQGALSEGALSNGVPNPPITQDPPDVKPRRRAWYAKRKAPPTEQPTTEATPPTPQQPVDTAPLEPAPALSIRSIAASGVGEDLRTLAPSGNVAVDDRNPFR